MPQAVGVIQTSGFPSVLAAADAMVKASEVVLVHFDLAERAQFFVAIRGKVSDVEVAMEAGKTAAVEAAGGSVTNHYIVRNPPENVESVLPIHFTDLVEDFRIF
ncbi:BMC domain-containing protein [Lyngbya confervoides]|uniref:Carboxysome shell protein CcmK n=1 Tax=Lyngbya confervoides BDU141951 TaxID=1574623 RepID=A0ABD4T5C4_9CYAN|nr:BMC domain-containing protein [Lyngbya confervoides]MCM1983442.1 BMC domain-containing protein [Lyngbya confervoides BDU141951]